MPTDRPSLTARWVASHRVRLADQRPVVPGGDQEAERRLYEVLSRRTLTMPGMTPTGFALRTSFFDAETVAAIGRGVRQIVILGAGYDGRPLRFGPVAHWIEVDHPKTQSEKRRLLSDIGAGADHVAFAPVDLMVDDLDGALDDAGHRRDEPTLFTCEGLLPYLPLATCGAVLRVLRARSHADSTLAVNFLVVPSWGPRRRILGSAVDGVLAAIGERRRTTFRPGDPETLLERSGWRIVRQDQTRPSRLDEGSFLLVAASEPA